jgi:hypothetical protein
MSKITTTTRKPRRARTNVAANPIEAVAPTTAATGPTGKIGMLVAMLRATDGATVDAMMAATGWQAHSVRGAMSGSVKKTLGLNVISEKNDAGRVYRIVEATGA